MKKLLWLVYLTAVLVSFVGLAFGAEAPYTFQSVDITVPGHPEIAIQGFEFRLSVAQQR
jgi:hypothetical protein